MRGSLQRGIAQIPKRGNGSTHGTALDPPALQSHLMNISRRTFVQGVAAAAAAPTLLLGEKSATLGSGQHTYEFVPDWGTLPNRVRWVYTHGVAIDSQHR